MVVGAIIVETNIRAQTKGPGHKGADIRAQGHKGARQRWNRLGFSRPDPTGKFQNHRRLTSF